MKRSTIRPPAGEAFSLGGSEPARRTWLSWLCLIVLVAVLGGLSWLHGRVEHGMVVDCHDGEWVRPLEACEE